MSTSAPIDSAEWRTPAACVGEMPRHGLVLAGATAVLDAEKVFLDDPALPSIVVEDAHGLPACLTRAAFFATLNGRLGFGRSLYTRHALWQMQIPETLRLDAATTIVEAARAILDRPEARRYDDCVVIFPDGGYGTLGVADLFAELAHTQAFEALHDALTGLANRRLLLHRLRLALAGEERFAVLFVDIDDFKAINDGLGHELGDETLRTVGGRLEALAGSTATVARLGGDEFAMLMPGLATRAAAEQFAARVVDALGVPLRTGDARTPLSASVGVALAHEEAAETETDLLRAADLAMYAAKHGGKAAHVFYEPLMQERARARLELRSELEGALDRGEFHILYQPIVRLSDGSVAAAEALLRWRRADGSTISPADFIPLAEQSGLIIPVGRWVLREACQQAAEWARDRGEDPPLRVTVNLSPRQLQYPGLAEDVAAALRESGLSPWKLTLEITEGAFIADMETALDRLGACKRLGAEIALDDFGSGLSSLGRLSQMPIDVLKLDRSFIAGLDDPRERGIVGATVSLGHCLELVTIGEGVETAEQAVALRDSGCRFGQGFWWARPMEGDQVAAFAQAAAAVPAAVYSA